jgi:type VI secretion system protein ImpG
VKQAFRDAYNRELALLKERAREFAQEYPGLADRLGGLLDENMDPTAAALLEGSAFLAARVQLKMQEEFRGFTRELLDQLLPGLLEPTPSVMTVRANTPHEDLKHVSGVHFKEGDYLEARYVDSDKRVSCRFALAAPLSLWPIDITEVRYLSRSGQVGAVVGEPARGTQAGMLIDIARVGVTGATDDSENITALTADALQFHLAAPMDEAVALYEQIFCDRVKVTLRWQNSLGDDVYQTLPPHLVEQVGFGRKERLFPHDDRLFEGFALLREVFVYPRKFLGFRIKGLRDVWPRVPGSRVQVIFEFDKSNPTLAAQLSQEDVRLHCAPAVNLFEEAAASVRMDEKHHEYVVMPLSNPVTHYEFHRLTEVVAHYEKGAGKARVFPLYALPEVGQNPRHALYFTDRKKGRRLTTGERRQGVSRSRYRGTETFITLYEPPADQRVQRLQIKGLCSNRHLAGELPIKQGEDDFYFCDESSFRLACIDGPTAPRDSLADMELGAAHRTQAGDVYWRLVSHLSLNAYGLLGRDGSDAAQAMREMMRLFADLSESFIDTQIDGLLKVKTRQVPASIPHPEGFHTARGLEVTLTFDEEAFEGSGVMLLGAVLDRFLAEYASVNSFTKTVIRSHQRGHLKTWPPRLGGGRVL